MNQKITLSKRVLLLFVSGCLTVLGIYLVRVNGTTLYVKVK
ncbi:MAG: hypothetical protein RR280_09260 [Bacteroidaceae bacterium]